MASSTREPTLASAAVLPLPTAFALLVLAAVRAGEPLRMTRSESAVSGREAGFSVLTSAAMSGLTSLFSRRSAWRKTSSPAEGASAGGGDELPGLDPNSSSIVGSGDGGER